MSVKKTEFDYLAVNTGDIGLCESRWNTLYMRTHVYNWYTHNLKNIIRYTCASSDNIRNTYEYQRKTGKPIVCDRGHIAYYVHNTRTRDYRDTT